MKIKKIRAKVKALPAEVKITGDFIKLDSFLKFVNAVSTGGEAKIVILEGQVFVNGEVCTLRGKKLHNGDLVQLNGERYLVKTDNNTAI